MWRRVSTFGWWTIAMITAKWRERRSAQGDELPGDVGIASDTARELEVEDRDPGASEHVPTRPPVNGRHCVLALPRPQQIPRGEQLGAGAPVEPDATQEQAVEHEQAEAPDDVRRP